MDFTRMRLEPLNGVLFSSAVADESSSFADDSQESTSSSSSRYEQEEDEDETSTLPSGNSQDKLDLRRREIKEEPADSQPRQFIAAADEIENTNIISHSSSPPPLLPIEIFTVPTRSSRNKKNQKKKYNDSGDSSPSSTSCSHSTSTASGNGDDEDDDDDDDDSSTISCLSSNASPIFQACRERIRVERANWADFYSALFQRHLDQSARVIQKHVRGMMQRRQYNLLRKKLLCYDVYNKQVATAGQGDEDDLLQCIGSFEHVYVTFNNIESNNTNDEAASTTLQGNGDKQEDHDNDHDDENSVTHFSITKWLAANHESRLDDKCQSGNVRDDDDDNTASTSVEVTDSSTDCDFLETIGNNNVHSAIAFAAPPPRDSEECYFIPCIDDHYALPVQKANQHNVLNGWFFQHS
jgi:hypothetical protein